MVSLRICPRVNIRRKKNSKNNLNVPLNKFTLHFRLGGVLAFVPGGDKRGREPGAAYLGAGQGGPPDADHGRGKVPRRLRARS